MAVQDLFVIMIVLFTIGLIIFISTRIKDNMFPQLKKLLPNKGAGMVTTVEYAYKGLDSIFFFVSIGLGVGAIVGAWFTDNPPLFFFLAIVMFAIVMVIVPSFANAFQSFSEKSTFSPYTSEYPMMMKIFEKYPIFFLVIGILIILVLFAKWRSTSGGE